MRAGLVLECVRKTYRARYYNPATGRFLSEDPLGLARSGTNLYAYAYGSPLNFIDPTGLKNCFKCAADFADKVSLANGLKQIGVNDFAADMIGGNAFSGLTGLVNNVATGDQSGHSLGYNAGQVAVAGPTQGFGTIVDAVAEAQSSNVVMTTLFHGDVVAESSWTQMGVADVVSNKIFGAAGTALESGGELTTLAGEASTVGLSGAEFASGVGEAKLAYDALTYGAGFAGCAFGLF
jgi:hypothetical protein